MKNKLTNQTAEQISNQTGLGLDYVNRVLAVKQKIKTGEMQLAGIATGWSYNYVLQVMGFSRTSTKIVEALEIIQENHRQLISEMPVRKFNPINLNEK